MKDKYIAAKERWAAKQVGRWRIFRCSIVGIQPEVAQADWRLQIHGLVENR